MELYREEEARKTRQVKVKNMSHASFFLHPNWRLKGRKMLPQQIMTGKTTGKRAREKELRLKRIQTLRDIRDGNLRQLNRSEEENDDDEDSRNIFSEQFWNHIGHEFQLKVNDGLDSLLTKEARVKADAHAFGIENESFVKELLHEHSRRVKEDGYTIVSIAETAKEMNFSVRNESTKGKVDFNTSANI